MESIVVLESQNQKTVKEYRTGPTVDLPWVTGKKNNKVLVYQRLQPAHDAGAAVCTT